MKQLLRRGLRRRDLVKWLGGAALALPAGMELFERAARADAAARARAFGSNSAGCEISTGCASFGAMITRVPIGTWSNKFSAKP